MPDVFLIPNICKPFTCLWIFYIYKHVLSYLVRSLRHASGIAVWRARCRKSSGYLISSSVRSSNSTTGLSVRYSGSLKPCAGHEGMHEEKNAGLRMHVPWHEKGSGLPNAVYLARCQRVS